jgi:hypothetical protein
VTQVEYLKNVKMKCNCCKCLVYYKKEYKVRIVARGHWMNDFAQLLANTSKYKTDHRYIAECGTCGKFYFATSTKKDMIDSLKYLELDYKQKVPNIETGGKMNISSTKGSSEKYGNCEVCGKHCAEVFKVKVKNNLLFGHEECLKNQITLREELNNE